MKLLEFFKKFKLTGGFLTGAAVLAFAGLLCRFLGVVLRVPLTNIVGNFGMGLYQMVYPLYSLLLIISSAGVPVAISKMVAKEKVGGDIKACRRILLNAVLLLGVIGLAVSALFMIFSSQIAALQGNKDVGIVYLAIAPSVFLVCIIAAFRGYFQGLQNMVPTATSQIIEQVVKVSVAIGLAVAFIKISVVWAVFGAILAVTISEVVALAYLWLVYLFTRKKQEKSIKKENTSSQTPQKSDTDNETKKSKSKLCAVDFKLMWQILKQSLPITLMSSIFPLILVFDSMIVINMLKAAGTEHETATQLFGISSGAVHTLINLPAVLGVAIATAVVPAVSSLLKQKKMDELREKCALAVKITFLIAVFFVAFYLAFSEQIIDLLYHGAFKDNPEQLKTAGNLMKIESALILLMGISSVFTAMLQGADKAKFPLIALAVGGVVKIAFELSLIKTSMGIYAVSVGNVLCFAIAAIMNTVFALHFIKIKKSLLKDVLKLGGLCGIFAGVVIFLMAVIPDNRWYVLLAGAVSLIIYVILVAFFRFFKFNRLNVGNTSDKEKEKMP